MPRSNFERTAAMPPHAHYSLPPSTALVPLTFADRLVDELPRLRRYGLSLSGSTHLADDLVQETMLKALSNADSFIAGSNVGSWLVAILRNTYFSMLRKRKREVEDLDGAYASRLISIPEQESDLHVADFCKALATLPETQRDVLILVGAFGASYDDAALLSGAPIGTVKSRLWRGRVALSERLGADFLQ